MAGTTVPGMARGIISDDEPVVAITDLGSSNGTFVSGRLSTSWGFACSSSTI